MLKLFYFFDYIDKQISINLINFTKMGNNFILDKIFLFFTHLSDFGFFWILIGFYFLFSKKNKIIGILIILGLFLSYTQVHILKNILQRPRPFVILSIKNILINASPNISFPSGHAANIFSGTIIFNHFFPKFQIIFIFIAFFVSFSRIYLGVHFFTDVLIGSFIGILNAYLLIYIYKKNIYIFNKF